MYFRRRLCARTECGEHVNIMNNKTQKSEEQKQAMFYIRLRSLACNF